MTCFNYSLSVNYIFNHKDTDVYIRTFQVTTLEVRIKDQSQYDKQLHID